MNILVDPLPNTVKIGGQDWPINTAFYVWVLFEITMQDPTLTDAEKIEQAFPGKVKLLSFQCLLLL